MLSLNKSFQKVKMIFLLLTILSKVVNGQDAGGGTIQDLMMDPRCVNGIEDVELFTENRLSLIVDRNEYERSGKVVCVGGDVKKELTGLSERDDWPRWISLIGNLTAVNGGYSCTQFAHFYANAYKALGHRELRRDNCTAVTSFCATCELGCPRVHRRAYSTRETMLEWAVSTVGKRDNTCQRSWIRSNIAEGLGRNDQWLLEVRESCQVCHNRECTTILGQFVQNLLMDILERKHNDPQLVWKHLCYYPAVLGLFNYKTFNLEARYNSYDEHTQQMLPFQNNAWWSLPLVIICMIGFTMLFHIPNRFREWFNLDAFIASCKRFKDDKMIQWIINRLATKTERLKKKALDRINRKISKKQNSAVSKQPTAQKSVNSSTNNGLSNGKISGPKRGPAGRGQRSV